MSGRMGLQGSCSGGTSHWRKGCGLHCHHGYRHFQRGWIVVRKKRCGCAAVQEVLLSNKNGREREREEGREGGGEGGREREEGKREGRRK